ncbi:MAG: PAS domain-containing protein, partial [Planctomycetota bacterium]
EQRDRSLAMLRVMSEGTDDLIFVKDIKGRFLFANPAMAEFCGVAPGDMLGKTDDEVMPAHIAELCRSGDLKVLATGASTTFGEELPTPSGLRHYNTLKQPYRLSDGTVAGVITLCHDITEVREQEAESRRLREIIEAITDASSDVIFVKDREGKLIFCNPAFAEAVGRPIDELIGTTDYGHLDELSRDRIRETDERVMRTGEPVRVEERVVLAGLGEAERIFDSEKHPYRLPDGSIGGVIGVARDVTDFLRAVDEVRDTEARLSFALSAAGVGYWDHDVVSDRVEYADTWFTMLGYEPGEIPMTVECFWNDLLHPDDRAAVRAAHKAYLAGRTYSYDVQCRLKHKSGAWHWIRDIGSIIERDGDGRPTRMVGVHIDIDERERQHVMLQTALVAANEGLWEWIIPDNRCYFDDMW